MNEIYFCNKIWKERNDDTVPGDIGYIDDNTLPEFISRYRFLLSDVICWEEYPKDGFFKNSEPKIRVHFECGPTIIFIGKIEEFDKIMDLYTSDKTNFKLN